MAFVQNNIEHIAMCSYVERRVELCGAMRAADYCGYNTCMRMQHMCACIQVSCIQGLYTGYSTSAVCGGLVAVCGYCIQLLSCIRLLYADTGCIHASLGLLDRARVQRWASRADKTINSSLMVVCSVVKIFRQPQRNTCTHQMRRFGRPPVFALVLP